MDGSDAIPDLGNDGEEFESVFYVEKDHIDSLKFKKLETTWSNGDVVPFKAMFVSPSICRGSTLSVLLSHSEFSTRLDAEDAATAHEDELWIKLDFVEKVLAALEVDGKQVWLVSKDYRIPNPPEDFVVVRVDTILSSINAPKKIIPLLEQAKFVRLRAPAR